MQELLRILLVEDDEEDYLFVRDFLAKTRANQFDLTWAATYEEGLQQLDQNTFSAVLVDYHLGYQTGLDFIQEVAGRDKLTPTILLTGQGDAEVDQQALKAGAADYLLKDEVTPPLLERSIRYAIERKQAEQKIREDSARLGLLANLSRDFAEAGLDYFKLVKIMALRVSEALGDAIVVRILAEDEKTLEPVAVYHPHPQARLMMAELLSNTSLQLGEKLVGEAALAREPRLLCDASLEELAGLTSDEFFPWLERYPVDGVFVAPLCTPSRLIGTLVAVRNTPGGAILPDDQAFYLDLANRAALAIENARFHQEVEYLALTDTLTGVYNRRGFDQQGKRELERYQRYHHPLSVIMLDIDHFKTFNDRYGHAFGDEVLIALTHSCTAHIRKMDIACRHGGDEFVILLPETDLPTARKVANRIRACFSGRTFLIQEQQVHLTASFGVVSATEETSDLDALVKEADTALYVSKLKGRNRVEVG